MIFVCADTQVASARESGIEPRAITSTRISSRRSARVLRSVLMASIAGVTTIAGLMAAPDRNGAGAEDVAPGRRAGQRGRDGGDDLLADAGHRYRSSNWMTVMAAITMQAPTMIPMGSISSSCTS